MSLTWPYKDPDEVLDYDVDWTNRLYDAGELALVESGQTVVPNDVILDSTFTMPEGSLVKDSASFISTATKIWLSGGDEGQTYLIVNEITTVGGRTMDQTMKLKIKSK